MAAEIEFPVMGSSAHVIVVGGHPNLPARARDRLHELETRWSRFLPTSEVSRLNESSGEQLAVSSETRLLVSRAIEGHRFTRGRFDATVLPAVVAAGYDRTFDSMAGRSAAVSSNAVVLGSEGIEVDDVGGTVRLPRGVAFDPGGIGKGLAADLVVAALLELGASGACVNVGGDLRVAGEPPDGDVWRVDVDDPRGGLSLGVVALTDGAVATSSRAKRRWVTPDGVEHHHLIEPITGASAATSVLAATVVASEGWRAEVLAKVAFLDGMSRSSATGLFWLDRLGIGALVVHEGGVVRNERWKRYALGSPMAPRAA
ncbi:MAG TPA: FAD:protein FMN transferase [Acidimicrobiales bacterium]|nr:FAD:protein FMN transferase [Acidimicrobiales bacterium]